MALDPYIKKRDFAKTPEPPGGHAATGAQTHSGLFCVQRHRARRLHYDLRLEVGGTLKSWAVPQGPSLDPSVKRLAVAVEDHPIEYADFEGVIPPGNYGAGSVMLWDRGTYEVLGDEPAEAQLARGDFKFRLHGKKLRGDFVLVRTRRNKGQDWLLIKKKDEHARPGWDIDRYARSVITGRTQEEIASTVDAPAFDGDPDDPAAVPGAIQGPLPQLTPMMALAADRPPADPGWLYEVKWDGVRALCLLEDGKLRLVSRDGNAMEHRYPELAELARALKARTAVVDGEIVALDERGLPSFALLQQRMHLADPSAAARLARTAPVTLYLFDLLYLNGWDLRRAAIEDRKRLLVTALTPTDRIRLSEHFHDQGAELLELARRSGLEGIVAKRSGSPYESRRSPYWLKIKTTERQEFLICGYTTGERDFFSSLVLGLYESPDSDRLVCVGSVGTGFDRASLELVFNRLQPLITNEMPFASPPQLLHPPIWVRPELVCEVKFSSWTAERRLRAPVFLGLRDDVNPRDCVLESPATQAPPCWSFPPPLLSDRRDKVSLELEGRRLTFTNLNKIFYPAEGYTKRDLINYYYQAAELILPYLRDRPLALRRYPDGIQGDSFFQKEASEHFPDWLRIEPIPASHNEAPTRFVLADDLPSLLFLVNLGCIDQNPWMSRIGSLEHPDFLLIDLDPQDCDFDRIVEAALLIRQKLDLIGLQGYPKTTGGDGLHIYVPIESRYSYEQARSFTQILAHLAWMQRPDLFTPERAVSKREKNKVYFDFAQLAYGKTISAPYVVRAYPGALVATPLEWREVRPGLRPQQFHLRNALERFSRVGDLFAPVREKPQPLEDALEKLERLIKNSAPPAGSRQDRTSRE